MILDMSFSHIKPITEGVVSNGKKIRSIGRKT